MQLSKDIRLFRRTIDLEQEIDQFLGLMSEGGIIFRIAMEIYFNKGTCSDFEMKLTQVNKIESDADRLRRSIETQLYSQTLIPEARGDVLGLLENLDDITNRIEGTLWGFSIEKPEVPKEYEEGFLELTGFVVNAVESLVQASRAFFRNIDAVGDHNHKVLFFEKEADKTSTKLKREIFDSSMDLSSKLHLRHFVENIDNIADWAEDVADRLTIYVIKRTI